MTGNFVMKGLTVFARPYTETALCNKVLSEIQPEVIFPTNKALCEALSLAISNKDDNFHSERYSFASPDSFGDERIFRIVKGPFMKPVERQAKILEYLQQNGRTSVEALIAHFNTTGTTIRKDLTRLQQEGAVIRTYGGVMLNREEGDQPIDRKHLSTRKRKNGSPHVQHRLSVKATR